MTLRSLLDKVGLQSIKLSSGAFGIEFNPQDPDRAAAWDLYVELLTRITTQPLAEGTGDEQAALDSFYGMFALTRSILKTYRGCTQFARLAVVVLNQVVRPFTAKWHRESLNDAFKDPQKCKEFRAELAFRQRLIRSYMQALAEMAGVEDLTELEVY